MAILFVVTIGIIAIFVLLGFKILNKAVIETDKRYQELLYGALTLIADEHKKTRKETQEIKTRLTQVRKDLNKIEEMMKKIKVVMS